MIPPNLEFSPTKSELNFTTHQPQFFRYIKCAKLHRDFLYMINQHPESRIAIHASIREVGCSTVHIFCTQGNLSSTLNVMFAIDRIQHISWYVDKESTKVRIGPSSSDAQRRNFSFFLPRITGNLIYSFPAHLDRVRLSQFNATDFHSLCYPTLLSWLKDQSGLRY